VTLGEIGQLLMRRAGVCQWPKPEALASGDCPPSMCCGNPVAGEIPVEVEQTKETIQMPVCEFHRQMGEKAAKST
jgi:hypothetical protein